MARVLSKACLQLVDELKISSVLRVWFYLTYVLRCCNKRVGWNFVLLGRIAGDAGYCYRVAWSVCWSRWWAAKRLNRSRCRLGPRLTRAQGTMY